MNELSLFTGAGGGVKTCSKCGVVHSKKHKHGGTWCAACSSAYGAEWRRKNKDEVNARIRERYRINASQQKESSKIYKDKLRDDALMAYGNKCACCGESTREFLAIDHVYNDGKKHRKEIGSKYITLWLKQNNYPKGRFQILCHNCNMAKNLYGECPHART